MYEIWFLQLYWDFSFPFSSLIVLEEKPWDSFLLRTHTFSMLGEEKKIPIKKHLSSELAVIEI